MKLSMCIYLSMVVPPLVSGGKHLPVDHATRASFEREADMGGIDEQRTPGPHVYLAGRRCCNPSQSPSISEMVKRQFARKRFSSSHFFSKPLRWG